MASPELTVIVPTRERPGLLRETLESILASADVAKRRLGAEVAVCVVDDASPTGSSREVAESLAARGVSYLRIEEHDGRRDPGAAIKLGVSAATTPYLTIFGDDDVMLAEHISIHLRAMRRGSDVSAATFRETDAQLRLKELSRRRPARLGDYLAGRININDGAFVRTELIQAVELDPALLAQMLYPVWATLLIDGRKFTFSRKVTFLYRRHDANISSVNQDSEDAALRVMLREKYRALAQEKLGTVPAARRFNAAKHAAEWRYSKVGYVRWRLAVTELAVKRNPVVRKAFRMPPLPPRPPVPPVPPR